MEVWSFRPEETVAVWPVSCFRWKPPLPTPSHSSGLLVPRWYVNNTPQSLAHCHASVVWKTASHNDNLAGIPGLNPGPSGGKPVTKPLGHGSCSYSMSFVFRILAVFHIVNASQSVTLWCILRIFYYICHRVRICSCCTSHFLINIRVLYRKLKLQQSIWRCPIYLEPWFTKHAYHSGSSQCKYLRRTLKHHPN